MIEEKFKKRNKTLFIVFTWTCDHKMKTEIKRKMYAEKGCKYCSINEEQSILHSHTYINPEFKDILRTGGSLICGCDKNIGLSLVDGAKPEQDKYCFRVCLLEYSKQISNVFLAESLTAIYDKLVEDDPMQRTVRRQLATSHVIQKVYIYMLFFNLLPEDKIPDFSKLTVFEDNKLMQGSKFPYIFMQNVSQN